MDALLAHVLDAHGGLERWSRVHTMTARLSLGGPFWGAKGWPNLLTEERFTLDTHRQHAVYVPFTVPDCRSTYDGELDRIVIETNEGKLVEQRSNARASFAGYDRNTQWDAAQVAYFASYALWNYLTEPFLFTAPGVVAHEIEPWQEQGQTWRRLRVTFPPSIATHNPEQIFYYDAERMQRRMDYSPEVNGNPLTAHYTSEPRMFGGLVFPTRRRVYRRAPNGVADQSLAAITIDIADITVA